MNWLTQASMIFNLLPALIAAMRAIEEAIPGNGQGELKLAAIREILEKINGTAVENWALIQAAISILVKLFNKTGAFKS